MSKISHFISRFFLRLRDEQYHAISYPSHQYSKKTKMNAKYKDIWEIFSKKIHSSTITVSDKCRLAKIALQQDSVGFNKYFEQICKDKIRYLRFSVYKIS